MKKMLRWFAPCLTLALVGCAGESGEPEPTARATFALTNADVVGFESVSGWSTTNGTLSTSTQHVQGNYSLAVSNVGGNAQLTSAALTTLDSVSDTLSFSLQLPTSQPNPYWYGNVQVSLNAPSRGVYSAFIGQRDLTGLTLGTFNELSFPLPPAVVSALGSGTYSDLTVTLTLNFPSTATYLLDDLSFGESTPNDLGTNSRKVHVVYVVPSDKTYNPTYVANLETAARHLQGFFDSELGRTFSLTDPIVTVLDSAHDSAWFNDGSFHYNLLDEVYALTGVDVRYDPNDRWLLYLDADNACNNGTGATDSVATFPANDLRGLAQEPVFNVCEGDQDFSPRCRWVGGMGHELGHILGRPHPPECEPAVPGTPCPDDALMWVGYTSYPATYFTPEDISTLFGHPVLQPENISSYPADCSVVASP